MTGFNQPDGSIEVVPYRAGWRDDFESAAAEILRAVPGVRVEHIGSTSVPGLSAKPTIDILVISPRGADVGDLIAGLERLGFEHRPAAFDDHLMFRRVDSAGKRTHHVHAVEEGSPLIAQYLVFRDFLRANPEAARAYEAEKLRLIEAGSSRAEYVDEKSEFVARLLDDARRWDSGRAR